MSKIEVNTVEPQCGTNLTLGANNDTVSLGTGAGFTGGIDAVKWETTPQTGSFAATAGRGYFMNTTSGALTLTLPSSPSAGDIVALKDYAGTFATNNLTIGRGGSPINGANSADVVVNTDGASIVLVYVDATQGWVATQDDSSTFAGEAFVVATGGNTVTTCGNDKIHTFTSPGTFAVSQAASSATNNKVSYLVLAGGGGAGHSFPTSNAGGGGGAGGYREVKNPINPFTASPLDGFSTPANVITLTAASFPITVGGGGPGAPSSGPSATSGSPSIFSTITAAGGGRGAANGPGTPTAAATGGSGGGGAGGTSCASIGTGAAGNTPPVTPSQGNSGGTNYKVATGNPPDNPGAGGGGSGAAAPDAPTGAGGNGGAGVTTSIDGTPTTRGGGGAGGGSPNGTGGTGGGADSGAHASDNTGGGGGGTMNGSAGGNGGSGIVIIRYKFQ